MGLLSILFSALAVVLAGIGVLTTPIPKLGVIFAFAGPAVALAGIMLGGTAMSRAKRAGETSETGRLGAILSAVAFVPSVLVALTCGVCNAFFSTGDLKVHRDFRFGVQPFEPDAGALPLPPPQRPAPSEPGREPAAPTEPTEPTRPGRPAPGKPAPGQPVPGQPGQPPEPGQPTLPPPPLPPGPGR